MKGYRTKRPLAPHQQLAYAPGAECIDEFLDLFEEDLRTPHEFLEKMFEKTDFSWIRKLDGRKRVQEAVKFYYMKRGSERLYYEKEAERIKIDVMNQILNIKGREEAANCSELGFERQDIKKFTPVMPAGGTSERFGGLAKWLQYVDDDTVLATKINQVREIGFEDSEIYVNTRYSLQKDSRKLVLKYLKKHFPDVNAVNTDYWAVPPVDSENYPDLWKNSKPVKKQSLANELKDMAEGEICVMEHEEGQEDWNWAEKQRAVKVADYIVVLHADNLFFSNLPIKLGMKEALEHPEYAAVNVSLVKNNKHMDAPPQREHAITLYRCDALRALKDVPSDETLQHDYLRAELRKAGYKIRTVRAFQRFSNINDLEDYKDAMEAFYGKLNKTGK